MASVPPPVSEAIKPAGERPVASKFADRSSGAVGDGAAGALPATESSAPPRESGLPVRLAFPPTLRTEKPPTTVPPRASPDLTSKSTRSRVEPRRSLPLTPGTRRRRGGARSRCRGRRQPVKRRLTVGLVGQGCSGAAGRQRRQYRGRAKRSIQGRPGRCGVRPGFEAEAAIGALGEPHLAAPGVRRPRRSASRCRRTSPGRRYCRRPIPAFPLRCRGCRGRTAGRRAGRGRRCRCRRCP